MHCFETLKTCWVPHTSPWPTAEAAHAFQEPHHNGQNKSPERGTLGGLQMQVDQVVDGSLHRGGVLLMNLGARDWQEVAKLKKTVWVGPGGRRWLRR